MSFPKKSIQRNRKWNKQKCISLIRDKSYNGKYYLHIQGNTAHTRQEGLTCTNRSGRIPILYFTKWKKMACLKLFAFISWLLTTARIQVPFPGSPHQSSAAWISATKIGGADPSTAIWFGAVLPMVKENASPCPGVVKHDTVIAWHSDLQNRIALYHEWAFHNTG